jgi:hypothetical protein
LQATAPIDPDLIRLIDEDISQARFVQERLEWACTTDFGSKRLGNLKNRGIT